MNAAAELRKNRSMQRTLMLFMLYNASALVALQMGGFWIPFLSLSADLIVWTVMFGQARQEGAALKSPRAEEAHHEVVD